MARELRAFISSLCATPFQQAGTVRPEPLCEAVFVLMRMAPVQYA
jgi:hypothetical protein